MLQIAVLALDNCIQSTVTGPYDILTIADSQAKDLGLQSSGFCEVHIVSPTGNKVCAFNGLPIASTLTIDREHTFDIVITPALIGGYRESCYKSSVITWLKKQHANAACICSVCASAFLLAEAGLLDGKQATTHWALADELKNAYPAITVKPEKMLIDEGSVISAGGVTAYQDLCLYIVKRFGSRELAVSLSKTLLIDATRQSQVPYSRFHITKTHGDDAIARAQKYMEEEYTRTITLPDIAKRARLGERTLCRRFKSITGDTPNEYLQGVRVEAARNLLEFSNRTIDDITSAVGYQDVSSFRRLFKTLVGLAPSEYRNKFSVFHFDR